MASQDYGSEQGSEEEENDARDPPILPVFEKREYEEKFDYENEPIIIPPDADPDINEDWFLEEDQEAELVNAFSAAKEAA